ncbi:MAG: hypothetical protein H7Y09_04800 [Chitinophagaceae bacterium]|nr:hypothetical protein [Anaerolineae bacterium]
MPVAFIKDEQHPEIVVMKYEGNWTVGEYENAFNQMVDYATALGNDVYLIADFLASGAIPSNILSLATRTTRQLPNNMAMIIVINSSRFIGNLIDIAGKLNRDLGKKTMSSRSLEQAHAEIEQHRKSFAR